MKLAGKLGILCGSLSLGYIILGYSVFGYDVCVTKGKIMSEADKVAQLRAYVHQEAERERLRDKSFVLANETIDAVLNAFEKCVTEEGFSKCEETQVMFDQTDVGFSFVNRYPYDSQKLAFFGMSGKGKNEFKHWSRGVFVRPGCWFTGISD